MAVLNTMAALAAGLAPSGNVLSDAGLVIVIGLVVVFVTLIALTAIFWLFGRVMSRGTSQQQPDRDSADHVAPMNRTVTVPSAIQKPVVTGDISEEVIAVIAAAVAAMSPEGTRYAVRHVSRVRGERSSWSAAGLLENTRPF